LAHLEGRVAAQARLAPPPAAPVWPSWLLAAVDPDQRPEVEAALHEYPDRGRGLSSWALVLMSAGELPAHLPRAVVQVYLVDPKALPLHDCEDCGLEVPIRPGWRQGSHIEPAKAYFEACPVCGGRVGYYARWHKQHGGG
jgi:hypothetical protein